MRMSAQQVDAMGGSDACQDCPSGQAPPRSERGASSDPGPASVVVVDPDRPSWIVVELLRDDGLPMAGSRVRIELPDRQVFEGTLDSGGRLRVEGIDRGDCRLSFPDCNDGDWQPR